MGFGHRVYKNFDPRAKTAQDRRRDEVLARPEGVDDPLLDIARKGLEERRASRIPFFVERKLYPNVDFYSGILYRAMGIPTDMFTVMFALGRLPGLDRALEGDERGSARPNPSATSGLYR